MTLSEIGIELRPMKYEGDPRFDGYLLEDSYVLGLDESDPSRLAFSLLFALTPKHPLYVPPTTSERHCYRKGALVFEGVTAIEWMERHFRAAKDPDGTLDYGNIDVFEIDNRIYRVEGEWGRVTVTAERASITLS